MANITKDQFSDTLGLDIDLLKGIIETKDISDLIAAFVWSLTKKGHEFWSDYYCKEKPLDEDFFNTLQEIVDDYEACDD